jgi:hypothetical protein
VAARVRDVSMSETATERKLEDDVLAPTKIIFTTSIVLPLGLQRPYTYRCKRLSQLADWDQSNNAST